METGGEWCYKLQPCGVPVPPLSGRWLKGKTGLKSIL